MAELIIRSGGKFLEAVLEDDASGKNTRPPDLYKVVAKKKTMPLDPKSLGHYGVIDDAVFAEDGIITKEVVKKVLGIAEAYGADYALFPITQQCIERKGAWGKGRGWYHITFDLYVK